MKSSVIRVILGFKLLFGESRDWLSVSRDWSTAPPTHPLVRQGGSVAYFADKDLLLASIKEQTRITSGFEHDHHPSRT